MFCWWLGEVKVFRPDAWVVRVSPCVSTSNGKAGVLCYAWGTGIWQTAMPAASQGAHLAEHIDSQWLQEGTPPHAGQLLCLLDLVPA